MDSWKAIKLGAIDWENKRARNAVRTLSGEMTLGELAATPADDFLNTPTIGLGAVAAIAAVIAKAKRGESVLRRLYTLEDWADQVNAKQDTRSVAGAREPLFGAGGTTLPHGRP